MTERLESSELRLMGDPEADRYVADALDPSCSPREWLTEAVNTLRVVSPPPNWALAWDRQVIDPPLWMKDRLVAAGQRVFNDWCLELTVALYCRSLPEAYASGRGAAVLAAASDFYIASRVQHRISMTGQMLLDITQPGGLVPGAAGYLAVRRVRLLHACVRALLLLGTSNGTPWPVAERGVPINQEDLLGTQLAFTTAAFDGMKRLGVKLTDNEQQAYLHLWSVVGCYLGIDAAMLVADPKVARRLTRRFDQQLQSASPWGMRLERLLLDEINEGLPRALAGLPEALVHRLAGARIAGLLDVPRGRWARALAAAAAADRLLARLPGGRRALSLPSRLMGRALIQREVRIGAGVVRTEDHLPHRWLP
jgi:mpaB/rubber oxygenase-like protein